MKEYAQPKIYSFDDSVFVHSLVCLLRIDKVTLSQLVLFRRRGKH